jgi:hypothetical protein
MRHLGILGVAAVATLSHGAANADPTNVLGELYFRFDSSALDAAARASLRDVAARAADDRGTRIVLDAHCDPLGTYAYNARLAIHRAEAVRDRLIALGVPDEQIVFAIYGKSGAQRATHAEDRRVTMWSTREPLAGVITSTFAGDGVAVTWQKPLTTAQIEATPETVAAVGRTSF